MGSGTSSRTRKRIEDPPARRVGGEACTGNSDFPGGCLRTYTYVHPEGVQFPNAEPDVSTMRAVTTLEHSTRPLEAPIPTTHRPIDVAWAALTVLVPVMVTLIGKMGAVDLAYHVRTGDMILRTGSIPRVDTFTFTVFGRPWLDQQWLAQVVFAT